MRLSFFLGKFFHNKGKVFFKNYRFTLRILKTQTLAKIKMFKWYFNFIEI